MKKMIGSLQGCSNCKQIDFVKNKDIMDLGKPKEQSVLIPKLNFDSINKVDSSSLSGDISLQKFIDSATSIPKMHPVHEKEL